MPKLVVVHASHWDPPTHLDERAQVRLGILDGQRESAKQPKIFTGSVEIGHERGQSKDRSYIVWFGHLRLRVGGSRKIRVAVRTTAPEQRPYGASVRQKTNANLAPGIVENV